VSWPKEKAAFAGGQCGAAFKSGKGPGTLNALAPYADAILHKVRLYLGSFDINAQLSVVLNSEPRLSILVSQDANKK
jgi:hypothetical protein